MKLFHQIILLSLVVAVVACSKSEPQPQVETPKKVLEIKALDMSLLPKIRQSGIVFQSQNGQTEDMLTTLKTAGANTIRLRIWNNPNPDGSVSNLASVRLLANEMKSKGFKVMLSVHYSDTWADPGTQTKPQHWQNCTFNQLKDSVFQYTSKIMSQIQPDYIQIGNEINNGFLFPDGQIQNLANFKMLIKQGCAAVRAHNPNTKIILHLAGHNQALSFFNQMQDIDYDIIGLSYYPIWHGKSLIDLEQNLELISNAQNKPIFIAETAYPFTLTWNDYTNNIIGLNSQILPEFEASASGQQQFLNQIKTIITKVPKGIGFCYWGAEWVAYNGPTATNGSAWENQALWNFQHQAQPALSVFSN
ncbi:glycosyl hydrolase 53 family protein [Flavobacterium branchiophilum]|uniref:Arabinogalactan endo-beta-1,4-galactanase n=1 Tax=Flavobacterium branchiophilum (strain FL-15) TaxID=1034807 RepID=G2Z3L1_FLABF|nr:glycosyl hydrolase 53 family protein [Flavobacterium branchiophilum]CCB70460.1 Glycoside hydrolase precursor, family 53. Putative arabinogalactan endo-1,4-beta-galactosidase precursor [Flavobacterium branchiophilum FL-15]